MSRYLYVINYPASEKELMHLEMKSLFNIKPEEKYFFSNIFVDPSRSPFIKEMICIKYEEESVDKIIINVMQEKLSYDDFKIIYVLSNEGDITYKDRIDAMRSIGAVINGITDMHNPKVRIGLTKIGCKWIMGEYYKNNCLWHEHDNKPHNYSNSLSTRVARALVNIAIGNETNLKLIDPCCGVGTVVIEGISMGIDIKGSDINMHIVKNAKENLKKFNYTEVIEKKDIKDIKDVYDVAIIDLPYGLFTAITSSEQEDILKSSRKIAMKLVLVAFEDMTQVLNRNDFKIIDNSKLKKGSVIRHIFICE